MAKLRGNKGNDSGNSEADLFGGKSGGKKRKITNMLQDEAEGCALDFQPTQTSHLSHDNRFSPPHGGGSPAPVRHPVPQEQAAPPSNRLTNSWLQGFPPAGSILERQVPENDRDICYIGWKEHSTPGGDPVKKWPNARTDDTCKFGKGWRDLLGNDSQEATIVGTPLT